MIILTGGTGYIGSHIAVELLNANQEIFIIDNLSNSSSDVLKGIKNITGKDFGFKKIDLRDKFSLEKLFKEHNFESVVHLAGLKSVKKSNEDPLSYYDNNILGTLNLLDVMKQFKVTKMVFSSSATVYGLPKKLPINENSNVGATTNVYGRTKFIIEEILKDLIGKKEGWKISVLRYFNPIGAHSSGEIGENPRGVPDNLLPFIFQVAEGRLDKLKIYGDDYDTPDGSGIRDYVHIEDLAAGHISALNFLKEKNPISFFNLGTGRGYSVYEIMSIFENISGISVPFEVTSRRKGDISEIYADVKLAKNTLHWTATKSIEKMIEDGWNWQQKNHNKLKGLS